MSEDLLQPLEQPRLLRQRVYERLEEMIIRGVLAPGEHLVETELAEQLGVSRNPVREALQGLQRAGWVELRPRHGAFVRTPSIAEVEGFFRVRAVLEEESARAVARNASASDVEQLRSLLAAGDRAMAEEDEQALVDVNSRFHEQVALLAGNPVLEEFLAQLDQRFRWYFRPVVGRRAPDSWREHRTLVEAFAAGDEERAATAMRQHVEATARAYAHVVEARAASIDGAMQAFFSNSG